MSKPKGLGRGLEALFGGDPNRVNTSMEKIDAVTAADIQRVAKKYLAKNGFDPAMGARPMARLIQDTIRRALADELLFGRLANGGKVTIDADDEGKVKLDISEEKETATQDG